ncbi:MAG TPA: EAL domain-containing protein [Aliidongia sp.]|nr:EAL domain-containing protein [Aliidongia sp.]
MIAISSNGWAHIRSFAMRHRVTIRDLAIIGAATLVGLYWVYAVDVFQNEGGGYKAETIELDEALLIGGALAIALLALVAKQYVVQKREVARRIAAECYARELAYQDGLTGLPNRRQFDDALIKALGSPPRAAATHGLFLLDLNGFKRINDVHGHGVGDEVLIVVARRLLGAMRDGNMIARFGGDEFAVLATHLAGSEAATNIALRIIGALDAPITAGGTIHRVGVGIGIALLPIDASTPEEAMRRADVALYRAKAERRSAMRFFEEGMDLQVRERAALEQALRTSIEAGAIEPAFLPTVQLKTQEIVGFEMIPHWIDASGKSVPWERFIPIAEETGLIHALAESLLRKACEVAREWPVTVRLSTDIYPSQLRDELFAARILRVLQETGLAPERLELEITESVLVADLDNGRITLDALHTAGVRLVLDNFGTGYSSLYHLRNIRLDKVKIDRSFVRAMASEGESASIVRALIGLGQGLGLDVAAEGIDDVGQETSLIDSGCHLGQGSTFSDPLNAAQATAMLPPLPIPPNYSAGQPAVT